MAAESAGLEAAMKSHQPRRKLARLESNQKISKRPLLHPPIAAARAGASSEKIIYVSASTPFISTIKRARKLLSHIEDRAAGPINLSRDPKSAMKKLRDAVDKQSPAGDLQGTNGGRKARDEEVLIKGTGKAIEKVMRVALYWQGQEDVVIQVRTSSVGAVDDVVEADGSMETGASRVRRVSCLEVGIRLR